MTRFDWGNSQPQIPSIVYRLPPLVFSRLNLSLKRVQERKRVAVIMNLLSIPS